VSAAARTEPHTDVKARDALWTVAVVDPIAVPLVARLRGRAAVTPNRLTVASALVAVPAGVAFALDELVIGAIVYQLAFLLDCMDGKLAKARGVSSPLGGWYDAIGDAVRVAAAATGLMVGLDGADAIAAPALVAYVSLRFGVLLSAEARSRPARSASLTVRPRYFALLREAPRRTAPPGTTVDAEALVFTIGPLAGLPVVGALVAAAVELLHLGMYVVQALGSARAGSA
jgi:phosphatidylglycerophosphate synthase